MPLGTPQDSLTVNSKCQLQSTSSPKYPYVLVFCSVSSSSAAGSIGALNHTARWGCETHIRASIVHGEESRQAKLTEMSR